MSSAILTSLHGELPRDDDSSPVHRQGTGAKPTQTPPGCQGEPGHDGGSLYLAAGEANTAVVRGFVQLAIRHGIFLHAPTDDVGVKELLRPSPKVRILWAHAGMSSGPDTVGRLLDRHPNLTVELALRSDVAPGRQLDPAWRSLFLRHPDRFLVGSDT